MSTHTHTVRLDEEEATALREAAAERGMSAHATHRAILRDRLGIVRETPAQPPAPHPAPHPTAAPLGGVADVAQLVALMRALQPPAPPPIDLGPVLAAMVSAQRGPDLAGLAALMQTLRPEPVPSPWPAVLGAVLPVAAPVLETYLQARADSAGAQTLGGALAQIGAVIAGRFAEDADADDEGDDESAPAPTTPAAP